MSTNLGQAVGYLDLDIKGFLSNLNRANSEATRAANGLSGTLGDGLQTVGNKLAGAGKVMTAAITTPIVGAGTAAVKTAANFDSGMSKVSAISGATGKDLQDLRDKAMEMGAKTKFSASEASDAMSYMAMAGWKTEDMLNGIDGIMNLAAASGEDLATTSDIVTDALTAFGLGADKAGHFSDVLAAASSNANTNVSMMGESFKYVAPVAGSLGFKVEDVSVALGLMANSGIKSSQAGTTLRTLLTNMAKPTDEVTGAMNKLGVSLDDGHGNMLSFREIMDQLRGSFGELKISQEELDRGLAELDEQFENGEITESDYNKAVDELVESAYGAEGALKAKEAAALAGQRGMSGLLAIVNASEEDYNKLTKAIDNASYSIDDITTALENNGVQWEKYSDKAWQKIGDGVKSLADEITYNLYELGTNAEDLQEYLMMEYDLDAEDAQAAIQSVKESLEGSTGAAEHMAKVMQDNLMGRLTILKSTLETLAIQIGELIIPYVEKVVAKMKQVVEWLTSLDKEQQKNILKWAAIAAAIGPVLLIFGKLIIGVGSLIKAFGEIKTAIEAIKTGLTLLQGVLQPVMAGISAPILAVVAAVAVLAAAFVTLWKNNEEFREKIIAIWEQIKETFSGFIDGVVERFSSLEPTLSAFLDILQQLWNNFCEFLAPAFEAAFAMVQEVLQLFSDVTLGIIDIFIGLFTGDWDRFLTGVKEIFVGIWNFIKSFFGTFINWIKNTIDVFLRWMGTSWEQALLKIRTFFITTWDKIKEKTSGALSAVKETISSGINSAKETLSSVLDSIHDKFSSIWEGAKSIVSNAIEYIKGLFNFSWSLPDIPLPHFSVSGSFGWSWDGGLELPSVSVEWYKKAMGKGMILDAATIFGINRKTGKLLGGGEAGSEVVVGTQSLMQMIRDSVYDTMFKFSDIIKTDIASGMLDIVNNTSSGLIDIDMFARKVAEVIRNAPIINNVNVELEDGDVYMDSERVGRKIAPVVSRVQAQGGS